MDMKDLGLILFFASSWLGLGLDGFAGCLGGYGMLSIHPDPNSVSRLETAIDGSWK